MGCTASRPIPPETGTDLATSALEHQGRAVEQVAQGQEQHAQAMGSTFSSTSREDGSGSKNNSNESKRKSSAQQKEQVQRRNSGARRRSQAAASAAAAAAAAALAGDSSNDKNKKEKENSGGRLRRNSGSTEGSRSGSSRLSGSTDEEFFGLDMDYSDMELRDSIGSGTYGQVFKCRYKGKMFALKKVFLPEAPLERAEMLEDFAKEVGILSVLRHDRIVSFKGAIRKHPTYALLFELCEGCVGTLLRMVRRRKVQVTWSICVTIAKDCAEAVSYLHSLRPRVLHRDLKSENLLLTSRFRCKLTDFGLSRVYEGRKRTMTVCGTPCWVAPEIFRGEPYNEKIDVYSFGVVLWELFVGKKPYTEYESVELPYRVGKKGLRPPLLRHCPPSINRLMKDCWHENAALRPTFPEIEKRLAMIENELEIAGVINSPAHQIKVSWGEQLALSSRDTSAGNTGMVQRRTSSRASTSVA